MLRSIFGPAAAAVIGLTAVVGTANAQAVAVEEESYAVGDPAISDEEVSISQTEVQTLAPPPTRVYGWTAIRPDCGEFKYWNGRSCLDARVDPPDIR